MKTKTLLTIFTITLLAMTPAFTLSQTSGLTPNAPTSFSVFSLPQNLGMPVNTADNESGACVAPNGLSLYFSSNTSGLGSLDLWVSQRPTQTAAWGTPQNLGAVINTTTKICRLFRLTERRCFSLAAVRTDLARRTFI